jgi:hypothetical protein
MQAIGLAKISLILLIAAAGLYVVAVIGLAVRDFIRYCKDDPGRFDGPWL